MTSMQIAETILEQLGGSRRLAVMTGARGFVATGDGLRFSLPSNFARGPRGCVNLVTVTLTPADVYDVKFERVRGAKLTTLTTAAGIYCDQLVDVFEQNTGLVVTAPRVLRVREVRL